MRTTGRTIRVMTLLVLALASGGCGGGATAGTPSVMRDRDVIAEEEIAGLELRLTALQMIQRLRPIWLQGRGLLGFRAEDPIPVYVNGQRIGGDRPLDRYTVAELREARFLNATAATQRFGTGHTSGAILLTLR